MSFPPAPDALLLMLLFALVGLAAAWDVAEFRIPNKLSLAIACLYPAYAVAASLSLEGIAMAVGIAAAVLVVGIGLFCVGAMGGGDVKLLAAVALWAGTAGILELLLMTALAGGGLGLLVLATRHSVLTWVLCRLGAGTLVQAGARVKVPYGVAIAAGTYLSLGGPLVSAGG